MSEKSDSALVKTEQVIQENANSLLDVVGQSEAEQSSKKIKKNYPANQVSPFLESFENDLIKKREVE